MNNLMTQIELAYGLKIIDFTPAPRGFCAETYFLYTNRGKYFVKIISNPRLAEHLGESLNQQAQIAALVDFVPQPILTIHGELLTTSDDNRRISLYSCIDGFSYQTSDYVQLVGLMAKIYRSNIISAKTETFPVWLEDRYANFWDGKMNLSKEVMHCVGAKIDFIFDKWQTYKRICQRIRNSIMISSPHIRLRAYSTSYHIDARRIGS